MQALTSLPSNSLVDVSSTSLLWLKQIYSSLIYWVGRGGTALVGVFGIVLLRPVSLLFRLLFRNMADKDPSLITRSYSHYKKLHVRLRAQQPAIQKYIDSDLSRVPWLYRGLFKDLKLVAQEVSDYYSKLDEAITFLNASEDIGDFRALSDDDLWNDRSKAYSYWA